MKDIVTDVYSFESLRTRNCLYVDKTAYLHSVISSAHRQLFISRPRRFGKSLMLSTLKCIFEGKRKLFKGLEIDSLKYDWKKYPVIHLDMTQVVDSTVAKTEENLMEYVREIAGEFKIKLSGQKTAKTIFSKIIKELVKAHGEIVVLIDEYDAPVAGFLDNPKKIDAVRKMLHDFYVLLKKNSEDIRFLMMTGVSKFSKLSVFSGLNNLTDLTLHPMCGKLFGYTDEEIDFNFKEHIQAFADAEKKSYAEIREEMRRLYDGYHFSDDTSYGIYNPVSVGQCLYNKKFRNYWNITGASSIIIERIKNLKAIPEDLNGLSASADDVDVCDARDLPAVALLFQGGYLTIKGINELGDYNLGIPNGEVRYALDSGYVKECHREVNQTDWTNLFKKAQLAFYRNQPNEVFDHILPSLYSLIPCDWNLKTEAEAKRYFLLFFSMLGADIVGEKQVATGIPDAVLKTKDAIYILEFKYNKSPKAALDQIRKKRYAVAFKADKRKVVSVGVNYSTKKRTVAVKVESLKLK